VPLQVSIDHQQRFVHVAASGVVKLPEVLDYYHRLVVEEAMRYPKLFDASRGKVALSTDDLMELAAWVNAYTTFDPRGPVAIVAVSDANTAVMRLYVTLSRSTRPVKLFTSVVKARRWLDEQLRSTG
jgi:hypothetical protein